MQQFGWSLPRNATGDDVLSALRSYLRTLHANEFSDHALLAREARSIAFGIISRSGMFSREEARNLVNRVR